jgi:hypothetical protein
VAEHVYANLNPRESLIGYTEALCSVMELNSLISGGVYFDLFDFRTIILFVGGGGFSCLNHFPASGLRKYSLLALMSVYYGIFKLTFDFS